MWAKCISMENIYIWCLFKTIQLQSVQTLRLHSQTNFLTIRESHKIKGLAKQFQWIELLIASKNIKWVTRSKGWKN